MKLKVTLLVMSISLALAGCGGGGGDSSPISTPTSPSGSTTPVVPTPTPNPTPDPTALQISVPAPSYGADSFELAAFTKLNHARTSYGVGQLAESVMLNTAASNHAKYIHSRFEAGDYAAADHTENALHAGFTGVTAGDRIAFAKYAAANWGENLTSIIAVDGVTSNPGVVAIETLLSGPYHRFSLFDGYRDVGLGRATLRMSGEGGVRNTFVVNLGVAQGNSLQATASGWIGVWPSDNATGVMYSFAGETPDPIPQNKGQCAGYPVSLQAKPGVRLDTTAFTLAESATGASVSVMLATAATDANPLFARFNTAYIIPFRPLKAGTKYIAHFVGAQDGRPIDKTWTFTTTADNTKLIHGCAPG